MSNPLHSEYCNCECPAGNSFTKLQETLNRVRKLHVRQENKGIYYCWYCTELVTEFDQSAIVLYPCETILALQGDDDAV